MRITCSIVRRSGGGRRKHIANFTGLCDSLFLGAPPRWGRFLFSAARGSSRDEDFQLREVVGLGGGADLDQVGDADGGAASRGGDIGIEADHRNAARIDEQAVVAD